MPGFYPKNAAKSQNFIEIWLYRPLPRKNPKEFLPSSLAINSEPRGPAFPGDANAETLRGVAVRGSAKPYTWVLNFVKIY